MRKKEIVLRYAVFIVGLFINAVGISLIIKASLGSSPISSLPYTLSLKYPVTLGQFTFIFNLLLILGQLCFLRREFRKREWLQLPISVLFSFFIDFSMLMMSGFTPHAYLTQALTLFAGCAILGLGISFEVIADVVMLSGEAFVKTISQKSRKEFGTIKIIFDSSLALSACIASLVLFGNILSVREGTIAAALTVGLFARFFNRKLPTMEKIVIEMVQIKRKALLIVNHQKRSSKNSY